MVRIKNGLRQFWTSTVCLGALLSLGASDTIAAETMANACPVDGCIVKIVEIKKAGDELEITFDANFAPDVTKNHFHVWWGEKFTVEQVGRNAEPEHGVSQGSWHRHADYPVYVTQGAASVSVREAATTVCVTAADRGHNVLDVALYDCQDASSHL